MGEREGEKIPISKEEEIKIKELGLMTRLHPEIRNDLLQKIDKNKFFLRQLHSMKCRHIRRRYVLGFCPCGKVCCKLWDNINPIISSWEELSNMWKDLKDINPQDYISDFSQVKKIPVHRCKYTVEYFLTYLLTGIRLQMGPEY